MATCTLNDMVPRLVCTKIFLEPIQSLNYQTNQYDGYDYGNYDVVMHLEIRDTVDEHGEGIADYLLDNNFRRYVKFCLAFSRTRAVKDFSDFLTSHQSGYREISGVSAEYGYNDGHKALMFDAALTLCNPNATLSVSLDNLGSGMSVFLERVNSISAASLHSTNPFDPSTEASQSAIWQLAKGHVNDICYSLSNVLGNTQFVVTNAFKGRFMRHLFNIAGQYEFLTFTFEDKYPANTPANVIEQKQDADGNTYYTVPIDSVTRKNTIRVENCYLHTVAYYDIEKMLRDEFGITNQIPHEPGTETWYYNQVDEYPILNNKLVAATMVQDFRISERVAEIIRSDFMTQYDSSIDQISLLSSEFDPATHGITTSLFSCYGATTVASGFSTDTKNYFYFNIGAFLKRKSKLSFVYNLLSELNSLSSVLNNVTLPYLIRDMSITRKRVDAREPPKMILNKSQIYKLGDTTLNGTQLYQFRDTEFENLTDGEYVYHIDVEIRDPMYAIINGALVALRGLISKLDAAIDWIHNHPQHYDELRAELSVEARQYMVSEFAANDPTSDFYVGYHALQTLLLMFTGTTFSSQGYVAAFMALTQYSHWIAQQIAADTLDENEGLIFGDTEQFYVTGDFTDVDKIDRRKIENLHRIAYDLIHATSKFVESAVSEQSFDNPNPNNPTGVSAREYLEYSRTWDHTVVKAGLDYRMMLEVTNRQADGFAQSDITNEYTTEMQKHLGFSQTPSNSQLDQMNFLTPRRIGTEVINYLTIDQESFSNGSHIYVIEACVNKPGHLEGEILGGLYTYVLGNYEDNLINLKDDSGLFESLLGEQGATVTNLTADAVNTEVTVEWEETREAVFGLDYGENNRSDKFPSEEELEARRLADERRQEIREQLFQEKVKLENLVMNYLVDSKGHHLLDRRKFTQGRKQGIKLDSYNNLEVYTQVINRNKPYPRFMQYLLAQYYRQASDSTVTTSPIKVLGSKFVVDNTFLVFYLEGFQPDMTPIWKELLHGDLASIASAASLANQSHILCKIERFAMSGEKTVSGQGSASHLEITNKYFYLMV